MSEEAAAQTHLEAVKAMTDVMKKEMTALLSKHALQSAQLANRSTDPHTPVIATLQLAFAQAAAEFLIASGLNPTMAANVTLTTTGQAMESWAKALMRGQKRTMLHKHGATPEKPN